MRLQLQTRRASRRRSILMLLGLACSLALLWWHTVLAQTPNATLFPLPEALRPNVTFWKRVFAVFDSNGGVLHDPSDVSIVYEVWYNDLPYDAPLRQSVIDEARSRYRTVLLNLADGKRVGLSSDEERVWAMFQGKQYPEAFRAAASNMRFQGGMRRRFAQGLLRSWSYMPEIEPIFASMGLPLELTMLPHVESSFENRAVSKVGAAGIWQFMPATGRRFLRVDSEVDERLNIRQATIAAARLLRENYDMLGTWPLAITAYNHGAYGMKQAVATVGSTDFGLIVQRYRGPLFGFASQNFYAEFLAAVEVAKNYKQYFDDVLFQEPSGLLTAETRGAYEASPLPVPMSRYDALVPASGTDIRHLPAFTSPYGILPTPVTTYTAAAPPPPVTPRAQAEVALPQAEPTVTPTETPPPAIIVQADALPPIVESGTFSTPRPPAEAPAMALATDLTPVEPQPLPAPTPSTFAEPVRVQTTLEERPSFDARPAFPVPAPTYEPSPAPRPSRPAVASVQPRTVTPPPPGPPVPVTPRLNPRETRPATPPAAPLASTPAPEPPQIPSKNYQVRPGETLYNIALRHNTTTTTLATLNKIRPDTAVKSGQVLQVPTPLPAPPPAPVLAAEKALAKSSILAVVSAGKPLPAPTEVAPTPPPAPAASSATAPATAGASVRLPEPAERFQVKGDTIRVAAQEQLQQYAAWLDVPVQRLQALNRLPSGQSPSLGTPVRLDFSKVPAAQFTQRRLQYQRSLEEEFLRRYRIGGVLTRKLKPGETLLTVSRQAPSVPLWLLQRYNTHLDANTPNPGSELRIPQVTTRTS